MITDLSGSWRLRAFGAIIMLTLAAVPARADNYPSRPVHIIIGFSAGAAADTPARLLAQKFSQRFNQQFIVENRPGAGSNIAAEAGTNTSGMRPVSTSVIDCALPG